ncbi:MAG: CinA family nicotinamide mononucleotide deamidase-related protein [Deltaproteobacteria bacterium]|nr:CinA family nicotinamide mononucleotide deamidase-related protein [Deltaproteobacteria bacterium]
MSVAILSIGTELTRGELVNSNASWLSAGLTDLGFEVVEHAVVDDDRDRIVGTLERLAKRSEVIVCTGGLGPTTDDLTTESVAHALGVKLVRDEGALDHIRRRFERLGRVMSDSNAKQADFPEGAVVLPNPVGTAAGFEVKLHAARAYFMPGVPHEMKKMFDEQVVPRIRDIAPNDSYQIRYRTFGLPESVVGEKLAGVEEAFPGVTIGYRAHFPEIEVKVLARAPGPGSRRPGEAAPPDPQAIVRDLAERAGAEVRSRLGDVIYGQGDDTFAGVVGRALRTHGWTLAIAESCTGGLVGHMITREPGASDFLLLDAVTYANSAKQAVLGIDEEVLRGHGAVSAEVATRMAEGARRVSGAHVALAITGIAGPGGGTETKPVGLVYLAVSTSEGTVVKERKLNGERLWIQTMAAYVGLSMVKDACSDLRRP